MDVPKKIYKSLDKTTAEVVAEAVAAERERCAKIVRQLCGETRNITLGDRIEAAINSEKD